MHLRDELDEYITTTGAIKSLRKNGLWDNDTDVPLEWDCYQRGGALELSLSDCNGKKLNSVKTPSMGY